MKINHSFQINSLLKIIFCLHFLENYFVEVKIKKLKTITNRFEMSDLFLFSSLLIFTIIKTIFKYIFFTVSKFYKNLVKWTLTEMECIVAGTTTLDREWSIVTTRPFSLPCK